jgi:hypothetical protein
LPFNLTLTTTNLPYPTPSYVRGIIYECSLRGSQFFGRGKRASSSTKELAYVIVADKTLNISRANILICVNKQGVLNPTADLYNGHHGRLTLESTSMFTTSLM